MTDDLDYTLSCLRRSVEEDFAWTLYPAGSAVLLAEVERLRAEVALLQQEARIRQAINDGLRAEVDAERAAVVAWLRGEPERLVACDGHRHADGKPCFVLSPMPADELADAIERGEHRREEER